MEMAGKSAYTEWVSQPDRYYEQAMAQTLKRNRKMATLTFFDRVPELEAFANVDRGTCVNIGVGYQKMPHIIDWNSIKQSGQKSGLLFPV